MGSRGQGVFGTAAGMLRRWFGGGRERTTAGAEPVAAAARAAAAAAAQADRGADDPPDVRLRAALATASRALWLHALGAAPDAVAAPERVQALRSAVVPVLDGALAERWFPRRPLLMPRLLAATRDPTAAATRLADIISQDPVLAGNVLRLANSAWYRITQDPVETLQRAVIVCGTDGLQSLAALALMQPVFRGESGAFARLPALLWERTTRARRWRRRCMRSVSAAGERQSAQLLVLLRALGPLVVFRIVDERYRTQPGVPRDAASCATLLAELGGRAVARIAAQWDSSTRIRGVLAELDVHDHVHVPDEVQMDLAAAVEVGELLGTASMLIAEQVLGQRRGPAARRRGGHAAGLAAGDDDAAGPEGMISANRSRRFS